MSLIGNTYLVQVFLFLLGASALFLGGHLEKRRQILVRQARVRPQSQRHKARRMPANSPLAFLLLLVGGALSATSMVVLVFEISMG